MSKFQIITLLVFGFVGVAGVLAFSGLFDTRSSTEGNTIQIWGTLPEAQIAKMFDDMLIVHTIDFAVKYRGFSEAEFDQELIEALASGEGPDAIMLSDDLIIHYQDKIYPVPADSYPPRRIYDTYVDEAPVFMTSEGMLEQRHV